MPSFPRRVGRSPTNRPKSPTQIGWVSTRTTLAATVVKDSEEIHVAKCTASAAPESAASRHCCAVRPRYSSRCRSSPIVVRIAAARKTR